jgi:hypothetical protein
MDRWVRFLYNRILKHKIPSHKIKIGYWNMHSQRFLIVDEIIDGDYAATKIQDFILNGASLYKLKDIRYVKGK